MIELIILAMAMLVMAKARPKRRRRMGRYIRGNVDEQLSLGTLAANTGINAQFDETVQERTLITSIVGAWSIENWTQGAGIGPLLFGVMHSDYSLAELEEWIETTGSWDEGNLVESKEVGKRLIRQIGIFNARGGAVAADVIGFRDGSPVKTKLNWILTQGQSIDLWVYNTGGNPLATTVPVVRVNGHVNLFPK